MRWPIPSMTLSSNATLIPVCDFNQSDYSMPPPPRTPNKQLLQLSIHSFLTFQLQSVRATEDYQLAGVIEPSNGSLTQLSLFEAQIMTSLEDRQTVLRWQTEADTRY